MESSGQMQYHLQKLSEFVIERKENGSFGLTDLGRKALAIYGESETTGRSLRTILCIPVSIDASASRQVGNAGNILRVVVGILLLSLTVAILVSWQVDNALNFFFYGIGFGIIGAPIFGFLGASFVLAGIKGYPGCEITAIPNLLVGNSKRYYAPCLIIPFNLPNGRLLARRKENDAS